MHGVVGHDTQAGVEQRAIKHRREQHAHGEVSPDQLASSKTTQAGGPGQQDQGGRAPGRVAGIGLNWTSLKRNLSRSAGSSRSMGQK